MTQVKSNQSNITHDYGLSETAYSCGYDLRLKYSTFMQDSLYWIANHLSNLLPGENPKILSLGCGSGIIDSELIKLIQQQKGSHWSFTGIDFSITDLDQFRHKISMLESNIQEKVSLQYKKFTPSTDQGEQYDLITMIHFLHSFDDVLPIIQNAIRHLLPDGNLLIIQQKEQGISEIKNKFLDYLPNQKFQSSNKIKAQLQSDKINFTSYALNSTFDIASMKKMSLDTLLLMSFCLSNDLSLLNTDQQKQIQQAFLRSADEKNNGSLMINEEMEIIVCQA